MLFFSEIVENTTNNQQPKPDATPKTAVYKSPQVEE
jgi:hypothetical protein